MREIYIGYLMEDSSPYMEIVIYSKQVLNLTHGDPLSTQYVHEVAG